MSTEIELFTEFEAMGLKQELVRGIIGYGFEKPSEIQQKAIVPFIQGNDLIAQAQSGTGKTATFSIAALQNVDETLREMQCIIISPTRELATQTYTVLEAIGRYLNGLNVILVTGGNKVEKDEDDIRNKKPQIMVGTPGRILHLLSDGYVRTNHIKWVIMDEADSLLSHDFKTQIYNIYQVIPKTIHTGLYTATVNDDMKEITTYFMKNPINIFVLREMLSLEGIKQYCIKMDSDNDKFSVLIDIYSSISIYQLIIYCNHKRNSEALKRKLLNQDIPSECIHGEMSSQERCEIMRKFRTGQIRSLITTDLLARGIDVQQVGLVINYDFPRNIASYLHRIGRTGRYGRKGCAINFITPNDRQYAREVQNEYHTYFIDMPQDIENALKLG